MRRSFLVLVPIVLVLSGGTLNAQTGWRQTQLNGQTGYSFHVSGADIFAATDRGVYVTADSGMPWFSKGPAGQFSFDIIRSHQYILSASKSGVHRSSDNGSTWSLANGSPSFSETGQGIGAHIFVKNSSYVFAIAWNKGMFRSGDDGLTWQQVYVGQTAVGSPDYGASATCMGVIGERIFFGAAYPYPYGLYSSSDNGSTWVGSELPKRSDGITSSLLFFYNDNGRLLAGGFSGIYESSDLGNSWTLLYNNLIGTHGEMLGVGTFRDVVSYNHALIAAIESKSIYISFDDGRSWKSYSEGLSSDWIFVALAIKPPNIWAISRFLGNAYRRSLAEIVTEVEHKSDILPTDYALQQNFPNPFNPSTAIQYRLARATHATLHVYNTLGQTVATLVDGKQNPGAYDVRWDGSGVPSGVYYYRLRAGEFTGTRSMILLK